MADWYETLKLHITKQVSAKGRALVEMGGLRADVRQIGESWLWNIYRADQGVQGTSLAGGCETSADTATRRAAESMAGFIKKGI
jgi:hypothetical protein